ncbi:MAG: amidohydrolase family protein [Acidobacteriota bacterium]
MKKCLLLCILLIASLILPSFTQAQKETKLSVVAFTNVNVVPMDSERIIEKQTVIVQDGRIVEIGPTTKIKIPPAALTIDGQGKYLMPGLAEMHGHLPPPNMSEQLSKSLIFLFVANGVTRVRGMFGFPNHISLREKVANGEIVGPKLYIASPALSGQSVINAEVAEKLVREYKQAGFDLLKVHEGLSKEAYDRIATTAKQLNIPFGGHVADGVGLLHALKAKQISIDHLDGYIEALEADNSPIRNADAQTRAQKLIYNLDERKLPELAAATREAGAWIVPTMALWQTFFGTEAIESLRQRPELKYIPEQMVNQWVTQRANIQQNLKDPETGKRLIEMRNKILKTLANSRVKVLLGSDAPQLFSVPGFSLQREMQAMIDAGLTPYQILESGTRNPALYFNELNEVGTVEVGKRADLILVDGNPLQNVTNVFKRSGVMLRGRWLSASEINKTLDEIATTVKS